MPSLPDPRGSNTDPHREYPCSHAPGNCNTSPFTSTELCYSSLHTQCMLKVCHFGMRWLVFVSTRFFPLYGIAYSTLYYFMRYQFVIFVFTFFCFFYERLMPTKWHMLQPTIGGIHPNVYLQWKAVKYEQSASTKTSSITIDITINYVSFNLSNNLRSTLLS